MNLTDKEILQLSGLCNAVVDGTINDVQQARLSQWLGESEEARQFYVRFLGLSASLFEYAGEMQSEQPDLVREPVHFWQAARFWWAFGSLAAAASFAIALGLGGIFKHGDTSENATAEMEADESVACLTGAKDCQWSFQPSEHLRRGQRLELIRGTAEITFDCGAQVTLQAPASLDVNSAWDATLHHGTLKARVPPEAIGFRISNPAVDVVDLGTEFSMVADLGGVTEVFVLKGAVEATSRNRETMVLREKQSRRFARTGVTEVGNNDQKVERLAPTVTLDRLARPAGYVHWSFDETGGDIAVAEAVGISSGSYDAHLESDSATTRTDGRWQNALWLDGHLTATAAFPGITKRAARTVSFWVNVPADAKLPEAGAMVAWQLAGSAPQPVEIAWNRNPKQGAIGALRTNVGHSFTVGTTSLRDGRWHHVVVEFAPVPKSDFVIEVKQYIDGRLEGVSAKHVAKRNKRPDQINEATGDTIWIGHRLVKDRKAKDRFRGALDELYIADRALAPQEILQLMNLNKLPQADVASSKKP